MIIGSLRVDLAELRGNQRLFLKRFLMIVEHSFDIFGSTQDPSGSHFGSFFIFFKYSGPPGRVVGGRGV